MSSLVPSEPPGHDIDALQSRVAELESALTDRVAELDRVRSEVAAFKVRYQEAVGWLNEELEELVRAIQEAELGELDELREADTDAGATSTTAAGSDRAPNYTSDAVRRLFRDVAKIIHPDLANDEVTRDRRHALMIEANRAYALGDEERLRWILRAWKQSPEAVQGSDSEATRLRLVRRLDQLEEQLDTCHNELGFLKDTPVWKLKAMVDDAATRGRDLVADTVRRLKRDIMVARNRLDAITSPRP